MLHFINREVFIYKIFQQNGATVGAPVLLFKGIISGVSFDDDNNGIKVNWSLTSHWGDFGQVRGRITSDDFHRALDQDGIPQPESTIKAIYAYDKGFSHAETSINLLSTYVVDVEKQRIKAKKGFFGIGAKVKVKTYLEPESRHTDLDFQLAAKSIPVIYGVRNIVATPIFADTLKTNSSEVYVAYAIAEGEIGGIYDIYIDGNSLICNNKADFDARSVQTPDNTIELVCRGRADRGDVLRGTDSVGSIEEAVDFYYAEEFNQAWSLSFNGNSVSRYKPYIPPITTGEVSTNGRGVSDGQSISLTEPINMTLDFFSGKENQKASSQLVTIAAANGFKVQNDYWNGNETAEYWGPNHRLIDTAYIVAKYLIKEGDTTIPELEFIIRGKMLDCYNYDYSYAHNEKMTSDNAVNFPLGSFVDIETVDGTLLNSQVQIIDKWFITKANGAYEPRFRFSAIPNLNYIDGVPTITAFRIKNEANQYWHMYTYNYVLHSGTVGGTQTATIIDLVEDVDGYLTVTFPPNTSFTTGGDPIESSPAYSIIDSNGIPVLNQGIISGPKTGGSVSSNFIMRRVEGRVVEV